MIINNKANEIYLSNNTSLDFVTRQLPGGYYSTFRTYAGCTRVIGLSAHLQRLPGVDASSLRRHLNQLLEPYRPPFGPRARRGEIANETRIRVMETKQGKVYISIEPLKLLPREVYEKGVCVETTELHRNTPRIKSTAFIARSQDERAHIAQAGVFEALMIKNGRILEGMTSNFFYIFRAERSEMKSKRGGLHTAQRDVLLGVTRRTVIHVARGEGIEVRYKPLKVDQLSDVGEAFITSSSRGIVPVVQIDDVVMGGGKVGMVTKQLSAAYEAYVIQKAERI